MGRFPLRGGMSSRVRGGVVVPWWKRAVDLGLLVLLAPVVVVVGLLIGCWIRAVSPGEVLFCQQRLGRGGELFTMYKFRSMRVGAGSACHERHVRKLARSNAPLRKLDELGDPRLIVGGGLLRRSGLDELPQLINVLRGEMSLIGPRPCLPCEAGFYNLCGCRRFDLLPGITGLWQVERDERTRFCEMLEMDERYVRELSIALDLRILVRTPLVLLGKIRPVREAAQQMKWHS
jgi:lipopolysaccharide/colanic/teichoic acid biosynthesis glycosyltransferase